MLEHIECPRCQTPNLTTEVICFACGAGLRRRSKRRRGEPPAAAPWPLWLGLVFVLLAAGLAGAHLASWLAGYRARAALPVWYLPVAGVLLVGVGQLAFLEARRRDRRGWRLRRAPQLPLSQAHTGDALWVRGRLACDTPLIAPYTGQDCAYFRYTVREREEGQAGWRETQRGSNAVDFRLLEGEESVYVPSGDVLFDAPLFGDSFIGSGGTTQVRVWALAVGLPCSLCGRLVGETSRPRVERLDETTPVVATWRLPADYVNLVGRRARVAHKWGWALTILGVLTLVAGIAGA